MECPHRTIRRLELMKGSKKLSLSHKFVVLQHSHKKRKDSLEKRAVLLVFELEIEISGVAVKEIHRNMEKAACSEELSFFFFTFRSYCYSAKACEAVVKIATDEKDYHIPRRHRT